ncbi:MAG: leucine-rich repeat domain-containing protein [Clostridia bacterium]|nr:leucine-rich repeat domain-containing protein [Clostridia bacterium]
MKNIKEYFLALSDFFKDTSVLIRETWQSRHIPFKFQKIRNEIVITGYKNSLLPRIEIPSEILGLPVRAVGARAFVQCPFLEEVRIADGVEILEPNAFSYCNHLTKLFMGDSVKKIGRNAFFECKYLYCAELSPSLREIESRAFYGCTGLRDILLPDGIERIGDQAFFGCTKLKSIHIPLALEHLPRNAFEHCTSLEHIFLEKDSPADRILSASEYYSKKLRYIPRI